MSLTSQANTLYLFLLLMLVFSRSEAQQSRINGIVSMHNSETFTGKRKYVSGAEVLDNLNKATSQRTDYLGKFTLIFIGISEGMPVSFQVKKKNLRVVNYSFLDAVAGQIDTIRISMADPDSIADFRKRFYNVSKTKGELYADRLIKQKEYEIKKLIKNEITNRNEINNLKNEIENLQLRKSNIEIQATELANKYAPINFDDATPIYRNSFVLFQKGDIDSALLLIKTVDINLTIKNIQNEEIKIEAQKKEISHRSFMLQKKKLEIGEVIILTADLYKTKFEFDNALKSYEQLLQIDSNDYSYNFLYANLLVQLNYNEKAIDCYKRTVKACESIADMVLQKTIIAQAEAAIGSNFKALGKVDSAFIHDSISLSIYFHLMTPEGAFGYPHELAGIMNDLSTIYKERGESKIAEQALLRAYSIIGSVYVEGNLKDEMELAGISNNLGSLYHNNFDTVNAELYYSKAMNIYRKNKKNQDLFKRDLVNTLNNLAGLYMEKDSVKSENFLLEALEICIGMSKADNRLFVSERSMVYGSLGRLYHIGNNFTKAAMNYKKALIAIDALYKINPTVFQLELADISFRLGMVYEKMGMDSASIQLLNQSLLLYNKHCTKEKCIFEKHRALILSLLGDLFFRKHEILKSGLYYTRSYDSYSKLYSLSPELYDKERNEQLKNISNVELVMKFVVLWLKLFTGLTLNGFSFEMHEPNLE